jgi:NADH:quinone reductase (non-electrogenic)
MKRSTILAFGAGSLAGFAAARAYQSGRKVRLSTMGKHVVILGGGFGGLSAASKLIEMAGDQLHITLVDQHNYHLFTPMLYQVATCGVLPYDVAIPLRSFTGPRGISFRRATVQGVDFESKNVKTDWGTISYDYLIIALGSTTNYFRNESAREHTLPLKSLESGLAVRNHVIDCLEQAAQIADKDEQKKLLTFVVIGGGATGVETAGALADAVCHLIPRRYPILNKNDSRVIVIEAGSKLLGHVKGEMAEIALGELQNAGVDVWLNTRAKNVSNGNIETEGGRSISAATVLWATGIRATDVVSQLKSHHGKGSTITVNEFLQITEHPEVFAIGDNAAAKSGNRPVPALAAAAMQEGHAAARNIICMLQNREPIGFQYKDLGSVVSVGHRAGVAEIAGSVIGGFSGWLAWRVVHLARITSFRNKLATVLDWSTGYFYDVDTARLEVEAREKVA